MPRIFVYLDRDELSRLVDRAMAEMRHPRDEARLILREALGLPRRLTLPSELNPVRPPTPSGAGGPGVDDAGAA